MGIVFSALLHLGFAALVVVASLRREKPPETLPPPAYALLFEGGAPRRPAEPESSPPSIESEAAPAQEPQVAELQPRAPEVLRAPVDEPVPPPPQLEEARTSEAELPRPEDLPPPPQREAALTAPPRPYRPPPSEPLPGLFLPEARNLQPAPPRSAGTRRTLDLSPGQPPQPGHASPEPEMLVRGAQVGTDWRNAVRRWWDENHQRYPTNAALVGEQGSPTVEVVMAPDGRVRSVKLVRRSGSVWLDAGAVSQFRGAVLPALPPNVEPSDIVITWTINYILR